MLHCSWDMVRDRCNYFSFRVIFWPFTGRKIKISKKLKKHLEISSFSTSVPKIMIRWCKVPEIWCVTDVIIFHFGPIFVLLTTPPSPPPPTNSPKNQNFEKMKKAPGDIITLQMCTKNYDQMMYGSWYMVRDRRMEGRTDGRTYG